MPRKRKDPPEQLYAENRRASGKRYRLKRDPNAWSTSILTKRANVLCLGMSYPSVERALQKLGSNVRIQHQQPSVEQAIELVRRNILEVIDGRDYARIAALEASNEILAYTVSKEQAGPYELRRHLNADFCSRTFLNQMKRLWGARYERDTIKFKQVILDYFWIPPGTWASNHWKRSFFRDRLPELVKENMLDYGNLDEDTRLVRVSNSHLGGDYVTSDAGVIYLPFCENCLVEVISCIKELSKVFLITFMTKNELDEHTLWKATNTIAADSMQDWLGKKLAQEEDYCKITRQKLAHGSASTTGGDSGPVFDVFDRIDNVKETRMIKLTALRSNHPRFQDGSSFRWPTGLLGVKKGGFAGLLKSPRTRAKAPPSVLKPDSSIIPQPPACEQSKARVAGKLSQPFLGSIINGPDLVLHLKNTIYKETMLNIFQSIEDGMGEEEVSRKALQILKQAGRNNQLYKYGRSQRKIHPVSDEEALTQIMKCISDRKDSYKELMQSPAPSRATHSNAKENTSTEVQDSDPSVSSKNASAVCLSPKRGLSLEMEDSHNREGGEPIEVTTNIKPIQVTDSFDETIEDHFLSEIGQSNTADDLSDLSEPASRTDSDLATREVAVASKPQIQPVNLGNAKSIHPSTSLDCKIGATGHDDSAMGSCKVTEASLKMPMPSAINVGIKSVENGKADSDMASCKVTESFTKTMIQPATDYGLESVATGRPESSLGSFSATTNNLDINTSVTGQADLGMAHGNVAAFEKVPAQSVTNSHSGCSAAGLANLDMDSYNGTASKKIPTQSVINLGSSCSTACQADLDMDNCNVAASMTRPVQSASNETKAYAGHDDFAMGSCKVTEASLKMPMPSAINVDIKSIKNDKADLDMASCKVTESSTKTMIQPATDYGLESVATGRPESSLGSFSATTNNLDINTSVTGQADLGIAHGNVAAFEKVPAQSVTNSHSGCSAAGLANLDMDSYNGTASKKVPTQSVINLGSSCSTAGQADLDMDNCNVAASMTRPVQPASNEKAHAKATETTASSACCRSGEVSARPSIQTQISPQPSLAHRFDTSMIHADSVGFHFNRSTAGMFPQVDLNQLIVNCYLQNLQTGTIQPSMLEYQFWNAIQYQLRRIQLAHDMTQELMYNVNFQHMSPPERQNLLSHFLTLVEFLRNNASSG